MPSPLSRGALRLVAALLLLVLASATVCAAAAGSPVQAGAAHAMAAVARRAAPPQPSRRMGKTKRSAAKAHSQQRRKDYSLFLCPNRVAACPAPAPGKATAKVKRQELKQLADWFKVGFECVDTRAEMSSCGGCVSLGEGQDCTAIPHASEIGCEKGVCVVYECDNGFLLSKDGQHCVKKVAAKKK